MKLSLCCLLLACLSSCGMLAESDAKYASLSQETQTKVDALTQRIETIGTAAVTGGQITALIEALKSSNEAIAVKETATDKDGNPINLNWVELATMIASGLFFTRMRHKQLIGGGPDPRLKVDAPKA